MRKSKILIALFAVLAAASTAKAEGILMNFDGRAPGEYLKGGLEGKKGGALFEQLAAQAPSDAGAMEAASMPVRLAPEFTRKQLSDMDKSIGTAIEYVNAHGQGKYLAAGFDCLRRNGTPEQKSAFVYQPAGTT